MRVITEELKGVHSFRGIGCIEVNGHLTAMLGSKQFDFGLRGKVRYLEPQIKRVPVETSFQGFFVGTYIIGNGIRNSNMVYLLTEQVFEGIPGGLINTGWNFIRPCPNLELFHTVGLANLSSDPMVITDAASVHNEQVVIFER